jgi:hypothetical protein
LATAFRWETTEFNRSTTLQIYIAISKIDLGFENFTYLVDDSGDGSGQGRWSEQKQKH